MFSIAILIGIYSYLIFSLGLLGLLYKGNIIFLTLIFFIIIALRGRKKIIGKIGEIRGIVVRNSFTSLLFVLIILQVIVNLIGALGPELAFDALWYHLTLPKLYLLNHTVIHIPGGLLYYSDMPRLTEMIYTAALSFQGEILAKIIHFSFGILSCIALYKLSRKFFSRQLSLIAVIIFYSNLVIGWQSITAYVDLARTFFEIMALWGFINWIETQKQKWLIESAVMLGLVISAKLLAIGSLFIFSFLIIFYSIYKKKTLKNLSIDLFFYWLIGLLIPLPWFVFSFVHTGNPVYPFFTNVYKTYFDFSLLNPLRFLSDIWVMFTQLADPISPIYIIFLPLVVILFRKFNIKMKVIVLYFILSIIIWYVTPRTGGGRFIMPYLSAFSIVAVGVIREIREIRVKRVLIGFIIFFSLFSIVYRGGANAKYLPVILGQQTKSEFLTKNLNFSFGDFYDTDSYFKRNIKEKDTVLLYGFHNLYYVDFPFIDSSWVKKGDKFNYVALQNTELPDKFKKDWELVHNNKTANVKLYSKGGKTWEY